MVLALAGGLGGRYFWKQREEGLGEKPAIVLTRYSEERPLMGTLVSVTVFAESPEKAKTAINAAFERGAEINQVASDYLPDSELTLFNSAPADQWHPASDDLVTMVGYGLELAELTEGAYDPTLGSLTHLWRETKSAGNLPSSATVDEALKLSGWESVEADLENKRLRKIEAGIRLDLGGLGKGYAADEMLESIRGFGIQSALLVVGGDVRCSNPPPGEMGWTVGLKDINNQLVATISVENCAVSTSGDLQQFVMIEGRRYSHIVDPETGLGLNDSLLATVMARNGLMADPLATAACVDPSFFSDLPAATEIHSRILSSEKEQVSRGFPTLTPYHAMPEEEDVKMESQ